MSAVTQPLPPAFCENMKRELGESATAFLSALDEPYSAAMRLNPARKFDAGTYSRGEVPWEPLGRYVIPGARPGAGIAHFSGAFYMQEASAMLPVAALDPRPGEVVLDLCAAPGGKSTQIAARMAGKGALAANEIDAARARILFSNIERMGVKNAVVLNETPQRLAEKLPGAFDAVLVDAPCSGEGMFRRDALSRAQWSPASPEGCAARQRQILTCAARLVAPGGRLVFSTCTFNRLENEANAEWFAGSFPEFSPRDFELPALGRSQNGCVRVWPQLHPGDGQFAALFVREGALSRREAARVKPEYELFTRFCGELGALPDDDYVPFIAGGRLFVRPLAMPDTTGLRAVSLGLALARALTTRGGTRIEPEHSWAMTGEARGFELDAQAARAYIRGEAVGCPETGWLAAKHRGMPLGWGKASCGVMKNHLPKGLRREIFSEA